MSYYKYAERDADSQINWAEVGKGISDMLAETNRIRQEKKDAIDAATREEQNNLANAPQGQDEDLNKFTNRFANNVMKQSLIDERLLKSGQMPVEKYTLRRQNRLDGTNTLFELSKLYQDEYAKKMQGILSGELQAINIFNMSALEGVANFNNSEAIIDSLGDGRVNIGLYENKIIDGKEVRVLSKDIAPVNVWKNRILQNVPTFNVEAETTATVKGLGTRKDVLYKAATLSGAGTITELMGPDFLATKNDPTTQKIVSDMNDAINYQIDKYFSNSYNLTSVLTENTGKYSDQSFTFDKDEAAADKNKILLKINPVTQMGEMDKDGPNYKAQEEEARNWVRTNILSKIDQERSIQTTAQSQRQDEPEWKYKQKQEQKEKDNILGTWGDVFKAQTPEAKRAALDAVLGSKIAQDRGLLDIDVSVPGKITFKYADAVKNRTLDFDIDNITLLEWNQLGNEVHGIDDVGSVMKRNKGGDPNMRMSGGQKEFQNVKVGRTPVKDPVIQFSNKIKSGLNNLKIAGMKDKSASVELGKLLEGTGIDIVPNLGGNIFNDVNLKYGDEEFEFPVNYNTKLNSDGTPVDKKEYEKAKKATQRLIEWIERVVPKETKDVILKKGSTEGELD